jgi:diguanylate cyclase (GGDEF)-like protein
MGGIEASFKPEARKNTAPMTVVLIDDQASNLLVLQALIGAIRNISTVAFTDPVKALDWCSDNAPDMVMLDYQMPSMNGVQFIQRFRTSPHLNDVPVLMITASSDPETLYEALKSGANDFLKKPVDDVELQARTRNMLKLRARQLELAEANVLLADANRQLFHLATTDGLTGVFNRRHFLTRLDTECARSQRYGHPLTLALLDADYFKRINDKYGHPVGDEVLRAFARTCDAVIREVDFVGRLGGEEFAICMPETDIGTANQVSERLRRGIESVVVRSGGHRATVTVSIGLAELGPDDSAPSLLRRVDDALYRAKAAGRNRVQVA